MGMIPELVAFVVVFLIGCAAAVALSEPGELEDE